MRAAKNNFLANSALLLVSVCVCLGVLEIVCRFAYPNWPGFAPQHFIYYDEQIGTYQGRPGFNGYLASAYDEFSVGVSLDARGYRNPTSRSPENAEIWVIGDSFAFGWGVEQRDAFAAKLENMSGREVYNFSLPATDLSDYQKIITQNKKFSQDKILIVSVTLENDILDYRPLPEESDQRDVSAAAIAWGIRYSAFINVVLANLSHSPVAVRLARRIGLMTPNRTSTAPLETSIPASVSVLQQLRESAGFAKVLVLLIPPRPAMQSDNRTKLFADEASAANFTVLRPPIRGDDFFKIDGHWTPEAHERAANMLSDMIMSLKRRPRN